MVISSHRLNRRNPSTHSFRFVRSRLTINLTGETSSTTTRIVTFRCYNRWNLSTASSILSELVFPWPWSAWDRHLSSPLRMVPVEQLRQWFHRTSSSSHGEKTFIDIHRLDRQNPFTKFSNFIETRSNTNLIRELSSPMSSNVILHRHDRWNVSAISTKMSQCTLL